ncbi:LpqB family beta-propeller domain-containing protein [Nonomuraea pusilla]|uniref:LpqB family beta-propeller domain-containing protein n=1 Tax=Nonomuraea pusilla TaxID=46177 RepID=UPI0033209A9C
MTRARRLGVRLAVAAAVACAGSGCAVIPVGGPSIVNDAGGGDPLSKPFQRMIATPPQPTWDAEQVVRGLQAAMAAYDDDPATLPLYLTPEARAAWKPTGTVTVIDDAFQVTYADDREADAGEERKVSIKARQIATIGDDDAYVPSPGPAPAKDFTLVKTDKGYRVDKLPDGLLLTSSDVARAYRGTNLYYLNGVSQDRLVVDRVWLRVRPAESFARTIVERLLKEPSAGLRGAVTTGFPPGTKVDSVRVGEEDRVVISLSGPLYLSKPDALMAQLKLSLNKNGMAIGRTIEVQVNGEPFASADRDLDQGWTDNGGNTPFYTDREGALHVLTDDGSGVTVPGAAGQANPGFRYFALAKQTTGLVAAMTSTGISITTLTQEGRWQQVIQGDPDKLTPPTWHRDGSLWTYDRKNGVVLRYDPQSGRGPERVAAPKLQGLDVTQLRIARDGVRVAVMTGRNTVQVGALTGGAAGYMLANFHLLTTVEVGGEILDIAWGDGEHVLVLVKSKAGQSLREINVGDGETVQLPLKDKLTYLAALGERILAAADTDKGTQILELNQDHQSWTARLEATRPLFPLS